MYQKFQKNETADFEISHKERSHYCIKYNKVNITDMLTWKKHNFKRLFNF